MDTKKTKKRMFKSKKNLVISEKKMLAEQYCKGNIVPYPSYMYSRNKIDLLNFTDNFGKYSDVAWLFSLCDLGCIKWITRVLIFYRLHSYQDSFKVNYTHQIKLYKAFLRYGVDINIVNSYRISLLYMKLRENFRQNPVLTTYKKRQLGFIKKNNFIIFLKMKIRMFLKKY